MINTAVGGGDSEDDPFDRPLAKIVYGSNTIEISCNLDEEEKVIEQIDAATIYER